MNDSITPPAFPIAVILQVAGLLVVFFVILYYYLRHTFRVKSLIDNQEEIIRLLKKSVGEEDLESADNEDE